MTDNETPAGDPPIIIGTGVSAPDPLQGLMVTYTTSIINTPGDSIKNGDAVIVVQPGGDINVTTEVGMTLDAPMPTSNNHVVTKEYADSSARSITRAEVVDHVLGTLFTHTVHPVVTLGDRHPDGRRTATISSEELNFAPPLALIYNDYDHLITVLQKACAESQYVLGYNDVPTQEEWDA